MNNPLIAFAAFAAFLIGCALFAWFMSRAADSRFEKLTREGKKSLRRADKAIARANKTKGRA